MNINRRVFFSLLLAPAQRQTFSIPVAVLETFESVQGFSATLVHHAEASARGEFAEWLRANPKSTIRVRSRSGEESPATIFRVRMCFGRGLIVLNKRILIRERDVLTIVAAG